jgi:hypothetical protein
MCTNVGRGNAIRTNGSALYLPGFEHSICEILISQFLDEVVAKLKLRVAVSVAWLPMST